MATETSRSGAMKLVEECSGTGELMQEGEALGRVRYQISRYQGMLPSGMPLPGLHRIEGSVDFESGRGSDDLVGSPLTLRLDDGRTVRLTMADARGRVLAEGHGPGQRCSCC